MEEVKDKKDETTKDVVSTQNKQEFNQAQEEITIMPTMIDDSDEKVEKARDLSAIIPQNVTTQTSNEGISLTSKDKELKGDGALVLATIDSNIETTIVPEAKLPEQIDIEQRKQDQQKNKGRKRINTKKKSMKKEHQMQNIGSLIAIIAIAIIGFTAYRYFLGPKDEDFKVKNLTIEVGTALPIRASSYVTPGVGKEVPDYDYEINKDAVKIDEVGKYNYSVTHNGITKYGEINIVDTTKPVLKVRERVIVRKGTKLEPSMFIIECIEQEGCNYSFQDADKVASIKDEGTYVIYVVATDSYENSEIAKVTVVIESEDKAKRYVKNTPFDLNSGYEMTEIYELYFYQGQTSLNLSTGNHITIKKYNDEGKYKEAVKTYNGEANYIFKDADKTITYTEEISVVGNNYSFPDNIDKYLTSNGFKEEYE